MVLDVLFEGLVRWVFDVVLDTCAIFLLVR